MRSKYFIGALLWRCFGLGSLLCMEAKEAKISSVTEHKSSAQEQQLQELKMILEQLGCRIMHEQTDGDLKKIIIDFGSCSSLDASSSSAMSFSSSSESVVVLDAASTTSVQTVAAQSTESMQETTQSVQTETSAHSDEVQGVNEGSLEIMHAAVQNSRDSHQRMHKHVRHRHYRPPTPRPVDPYVQVENLAVPVSSDSCPCCCIQ